MVDSTNSGTNDENRDAQMMEVVDFLLSNKCVSVSFLTGAGVSVNAGIPDFRSKGGMYDTLQPDLLTASTEDKEAMKADPTHVVSKDLFTRNQLPYLEMRRPLILDNKLKPTVSHFF